MASQPHIGVIGAGIAGLRCADVLLQRGFQVTVLEGRNRIGGRIQQCELGTHLVDMGANWIHGTTNNPIYEISKVTNTALFEPTGPHMVLGRDGRFLPPELTEKITDFLFVMVDQAVDYSKEKCDEIPADLSLLDYIHQHLEQADFTDAEKEACVEFSKTWGSYVGSPIDRQSLKFFSLEEGVDGANPFVAGSYKRILEHIARPALEKADVRLNDAVVRVDAGPREAGEPVTVTTVAGKTYQFDELVVTFPLGWLKNNRAAFHPPLPPRLSRAIDSISYGDLEKVYVQFPCAWWAQPGPGSSGPSQNSSSASGPLPMLTGSFVDFLNPAYVSPQPPSPYWNQEAFLLSSISPPAQAQPTLLFYFYGPSAIHLAHLHAACADSGVVDAPNADSKSSLAASLISFLHPYISHLPNYSPSSPSCHPTAILPTRWATDPLAGYGSYANFQVGLADGLADAHSLRTSDGIGRERCLWLAGEHAAPVVGLGTTVGAYWSGEEAAERVYGVWKEEVTGDGVRSKV